MYKFKTLLIIGKHAVEERERLKKRGTSKPGRAVVISGESTEPPFDDVPVDLSADHKDLVMEYSGNITVKILSAFHLLFENNFP